jgi:hypothetical protein
MSHFNVNSRSFAPSSTRDNDVEKPGGSLMMRPQNLLVAGMALLLGVAGIYLNVQSRAASMPELPVTVGFHHAALEKSLVADFSSHAASNMAVIVDVVDAASHAHRRFRVTVGPGHPTAFGHFQGYGFEPGDTLTIAHVGYKPIAVQVPSI